MKTLGRRAAPAEGIPALGAAARLPHRPADVSPVPAGGAGMKSSPCASPGKPRLTATELTITGKREGQQGGQPSAFAPLSLVLLLGLQRGLLPAAAVSIISSIPLSLWGSLCAGVMLGTQSLPGARRGSEGWCSCTINTRINIPGVCSRHCLGV